MIMLDGREVKIGDKLYCLIYGWGVVVWDTYNGQYISVRNNIGTFCYTPVGEYLHGGNRTLYWNEVSITPPPPPKRKVKKWHWVAKVQSGGLFVTSGLYASEEEYHERYRLVSSDTFVQKIDSTEVEVEE